MVWTKKVTSIAIGVFAIVAVLFAALPTQQASAGYYWGAEAPRRGGFPAGGYVYSSTWQTCDEQLFCWMEVHANLWKKIDGVWTFRGGSKKGGDWVNTVRTTHQKWESALNDYWFKNVGEIEYDVYGDDYQHFYVTGGPVYI